ncbi:MipA/OmpV family protein [Sphingomonas aerophila]|uniref:Outer membrane protein n=1 Tax=Sphingomonas aerophila TaxID=1344948 RepID=A0A7W9EUX7_9SPHN|nr:MipA/OmpV family protein [Sphingomonas aerophila]MBB5715744.1 outer membrane protein [Sphingomonas aerophila]
MRSILLLALPAVLAPAAADAQSTEESPRRTRVALGPQLTPSYPGADTVSLRPLVDVARSRGDAPFAFEAADESFGPGLFRKGPVGIGLAIGFEGKRSRGDTDGRLSPVGFTVEAGGFINYQVAAPFRLRIEARQGIGGHKGLIASVGADYVARDGDRWLFSLGPRVTLASARYNRAYFGVRAADVVTARLPAYRPDGGLQAVGATAGLVRQFTPRWGVYAYTRYDRFVADPGRSPVLREIGSRNQLAGGVALTHTFGRGVH